VGSHPAYSGSTVAKEAEDSSLDMGTIGLGSSVAVHICLKRLLIRSIGEETSPLLRKNSK
jgi:hypothetical protein